MRLTVTGTSLISKDRLLQSKDALRFYAKRLLTKHQLKELKLHFHVTTTLRNCIAECGWNGKKAHRPTSFTIAITPEMSLKRFLMSLGHEMIHLKQTMSGEMTDLVSTDYTQAKWCGKRYTRNDKDNHIYYNQPWEIEAYGKERGLYFLFKEEQKEKKKLALERKRKKR